MTEEIIVPVRMTLITGIFCFKQMNGVCENSASSHAWIRFPVLIYCILTNKKTESFANVKWFATNQQTSVLFTVVSSSPRMNHTN